MSGLVVVSAVYVLREHGLSTRERRLRKELINSQAEITKLVMKVIYEQAFMLLLQRASGAFISSAITHFCIWVVDLVCAFLQIVNMQHSMQSPGRVPIIRHTCSMSAVTPFPLMHLV